MGKMYFLFHVIISTETTKDHQHWQSEAVVWQQTDACSTSYFQQVSVEPVI